LEPISGGETGGEILRTNSHFTEKGLGGNYAQVGQEASETEKILQRGKEVRYDPLGSNYCCCVVEKMAPNRSCKQVAFGQKRRREVDA